MKKAPLILMLCILCSAVPGLVFAQPEIKPHVKAALIAEDAGVQPGRPFWVGLHLAMDEGWHTYWENPGDSGLATAINWELPEGFNASPIHWPFPQIFDEEGLTTYGYTDEAVLLVEITPPAEITVNTVELKARTKWLECKDICIPGKADLSLALPVANDMPEANEAAGEVFSKARQSLPVQHSKEIPWRVSAELKKDRVILKIDPAADAAGRLGEIVFFPRRDDLIDHGAKQQLQESGGGYELVLERSALFEGGIQNVEGVLVCETNWGSAGGARALDVNVPLKVSQ